MKALCLVLPFVCAAAAANPGDVVLTSGGKPEAVLVIAKDAPSSVLYAAQELQTHLEKMSGARLPLQTIVSPDEAPQDRPLVLLGDNPLARAMGLVPDGLTPDGYRIRTGPGRLAIVGRDDTSFDVDFRHTPTSTGTLYGVYRLLEDLGVRWFYPTDLGTVIPERKDVVIGPRSVDDAPYCLHDGSKALAFRRILQVLQLEWQDGPSWKTTEAVRIHDAA